MNMWAFTPRVFGQLRERFEQFLESHGSAITKARVLYSHDGERAGACRARRASKSCARGDSWFGVTYREDRPRVVESIRRLIAAGAYPEKLWP